MGGLEWRLLARGCDTVHGYTTTCRDERRSAAPWGGVRQAPTDGVLGSDGRSGGGPANSVTDHGRVSGSAARQRFTNRRPAALEGTTSMLRQGDCS